MSGPGRRFPEAVADAANRLHPLTGVAQLRAQPLDVHVDGACLDIGLRLPHRLEQLRAAQHPVAPLDELVEEPELGRRELDLLAAHRDAMRAPIQRNRTGGEPTPQATAGAARRRKMAATRSTSSLGENGLAR